MRRKLTHFLCSPHTHAGRERFKNKAKWWFINGELSAANRDSGIVVTEGGKEFENGKQTKNMP